MALFSLCSHSRGAMLWGRVWPRSAQSWWRETTVMGDCSRGMGDSSTDWSDLHRATLSVTQAWLLTLVLGKCTLCSRNTFFSSEFCFFWKIYPFSSNTLMLLKHVTGQELILSHQSLALNHKTCLSSLIYPVPSCHFPLGSHSKKSG